MLQKTLGGIFHEKAIYNHCFNRYFNYNRYLCTIKYSNRSSQPFWGSSKDAPGAANFYLFTYWGYYYLLLNFKNKLATGLK